MKINFNFSNYIQIIIFIVLINAANCFLEKIKKYYLYRKIFNLRNIII